MRTNDMWASYKLDKEEQILAAAEEILSRKLIRHGTLTDPSASNNLLRMRCASLGYEVFGCIFLDTRHHIIAIEDLFTGTIDGAEVHPRTIAKRALELDAAAIIAFHNHPSGNPEPSAADRAMTARLKQAMQLLDIRLLDHIVVSAGSCVSMASKGWV